MNARLITVLTVLVAGTVAVGTAQGQPATAQAGECYASSGGNTDTLFRIDVTTGASVASLSTGVGDGLPGLAIDSQGRIFAASRGVASGVPALYQLDAVTGAATHIGDLADAFGGLAFDSSDRLIGVTPGGLTHEVNPVDASSTELSSFSGNLSGLAFDASDVLYATSGKFDFGGIGPDAIGTLDPITGNETVLGSLGTLIDGTPDVAFDYQGNLYVSKGQGDGTTGGGSQLYLVDQSTWLATALLNPVGGSAGGLACDRRSPEPPEEDEKVLVCHRGKTLHVGAGALAAHLGHGDVEGACEDGEDDRGRGKAKNGKVGDVVPESFGISQNYPNPFNPTTTISFALPEQASVRLAVYNALGQQVKVLVSSTLEAGTHSVTWNATDHDGQRVSTGLYIYRLTAGTYVETRKMLLLE